MNSHKTLGFVAGAAVAVLFCHGAIAAWPTTEMAVATNTNQYATPAVVLDGAGGVVVSWFSNNIFYAQRIDQDGTMLWAANGANLGDFTGVGEVVTVADGNGGFILVYQRAGNIYAQHVNSTGAPDWEPPGLGYPYPVSVCTNAANQYHPKADTDGAGGVIIAWTDYRDASMVIYAQRMDAAGVPQWAADGVPLSTPTYGHIYPLVLADGLGGAFVSCDVWGATGFSDLYCQHVDATGATTWGPGGIRVSEEHTGLIPAATNDHNWNLLSDGAGGAISTWRHTPYTNKVSIKASRLSAGGAKVWADSVVALTPQLSSETMASSARSATNGDGGLVTGWHNVTASSYNLFINRVDGNGDLAWSGTTAGIPLCVQSGTQNGLRLCVDSSGVTWATWRDARSGAFQAYSQHLDVDGAPLGTPDGDPFDVNRDPYTSTPVPVPGGVFVAYTDKRNPAPDSTTDLYAKVLGGSVSAVRPFAASDLSLSANWPNPFGSETRIAFATGRSGSVDLAVYDVRGRRVRNLAGDAIEQGGPIARWDGRDNHGNSLAAGVYFVRLRSGHEMVSRRVTLIR